MRRAHVVRVLGEGGLGHTVQIRWRDGYEPDRALKVLTNATPARRALLQRELFVLRRLAHPALVRALDYGTFVLEDSLETTRVTGLVLELIEGEELSAERDFARACSVLADALEALQSLHLQGFVHGDVKPDNVRVRPGGQGVLLDLSAAAPIGAAATHSFSGTLGFSAPETGTVQIARELDVFAVGRTLEALAKQCTTHLSGELLAFACAATRGDPAERPRELDTLLEVLRGPMRRFARAAFVPPLVGRDELLSTLEQTIVRDGPAAICLVGPEGSGRSRVLEELRWRLAERAYVVQLAQGDWAGTLARHADTPVDRPSAIAEALSVIAARHGAPVVLLAEDDEELDALHAALTAEHVLVRVGTPRKNERVFELPTLSLTDAHTMFPAHVAPTLVAYAHAHAPSTGALARIASYAAEHPLSEATIDRLFTTKARTVPLDPARARIEGMSAYEAGQSQRALAVLLPALRHAPASSRAPLWLCIAGCVLAQGQIARAQKLAARAPESPEKIALAAEIAQKRGAYTDVRALCTEWRDRLEGSARTSLLISDAVAAILLDAIDAERALADAAAQTSMTPRLQYRLASAEALAAHRRGQGAARAFVAARALADRLGLDDVRATAAYNVATAQEARGRIGDALDAYERTVQLAMHARNAALEARARFAIANVMSELKLTDRALRHAEAAERAAQRVPLLAALCATLAGEARGDWMQIARARAKLPADRQEGIEALEIALSEARVRGQTTAHALIAWAERLLATDLLARAQLLASDDDLAIGALEELAPRLSGWRALDVYERLAKVCAARGASLRAREHAEAALRVGEALLVEIPAGLRESLATRLTRLRAPNAASAPEPSPQPSEDFARLFELQARLTNAPDVDGLLGLALDSAIASAGAERGFVMFARGEQLEVRAARNLDAERLSARESSFSRSVVQEALRSQTPLFAARIDGADDFLQRQRSVHAQRLRAVVVLPFTTTRGARGALYLDNRFVATAPSPRAKELLLFLRDQIAQALDRALLIDELAAQNRELERQRAELAELLRAERVEQERRAEGERRLRARRASAGRFPDIVGDSEVLQRALGLLERVAPTDVTVLLEGESGTGKELFARALHRASTRAEAPFVAINCGAIPEALLEAELFGAVRGAFTGSVKDTRGLFVTADGGTLLLDEIGEMPLAMQVKLLRVLQQREVRALGAERAQPIDVRIVTATHRDLDARVREGLFREDLFFRLSVVKIHIPPLRERGADVITIAERILDRAGERLGLPRPTLGTSALRALSQHAFPGNVRELENVLTKALVLGAHESTLEAEHLGLATTPWRRTQRAPAVEEEKTLRAALSANGGNVVQAAKQLGMPRATFYRKLARYGIEHRQS